MTRPWRSGAANAVLLVAPTILTAAGLYWMSSGRARGISVDSSVAFLLFVPWQTLGLTIVKCGVDSWILSSAGEWRGRSLSLGSLVLRIYLPLTIAVGLMLFLRLPLLACAVAAVSSLVDAVATLLATEMAAHGRIRSSGATTLLKYPLFFVLVFGIGEFEPVGFGVLLQLFLLTSVLRLGALLLLRPASREAGERRPNTMILGVQQVLNYGLFKNDQLATGILNRSSSATDALFVYLVRFPELVSAVVNATGPMTYPHVYKARSKTRLFGVPGDRRTLAVAMLIVGAAAIYGATAATSVAQGLWPLLPAVTLHAILVFPVNYRTYVLLRQRRDRDLVSGLLKANVLGVIVIALAAIFFLRIPPAVLWIIPIQQIAFLLATNHAV